MVKYILQRMLYMIMVFFIITLMCFVLVRMLPLPVLPPDDPSQRRPVIDLAERELNWSRIWRSLGCF